MNIVNFGYKSFFSFSSGRHHAVEHSLLSSTSVFNLAFVPGDSSLLPAIANASTLAAILFKPMMFDITVDKQLDIKCDFDMVAGVIRQYYPFLNCYNSEIVFNDDEKLNSNNNYVWFDIVNTPDDKIWTSAIDFHFFPDHISASGFPQIQLTEQISKILNCNCICNNLTEIVSGLDKHDLYWTVAYVNKQWYFADTANMKLMGPYTDGINETAGDAELNLLYKLDLTNAKTNLYDYNVLKRNGS